MGVESFETSAQASKRGAKRARVLLTATLHTPHQQFEARLRDISQMGALIESPALVKVGMPVTFQRGATRIPGKVAWYAGYRIGIAFDDPIDENELLIHIGKPKPAASGAYAPHSAYAGLSGRNRKIAQAWSVAVGLNLPERED